MKHLKKILALVLIAVSLLTIALPAMAASGSSPLSGGSNSDTKHQVLSSKKKNFEYDFTITTTKPSQKYYVALQCVGGGTLNDGNFYSNGPLHSMYGFYAAGSNEYWLRVHPAGHAMTVDWECMAY